MKHISQAIAEWTYKSENGEQQAALLIECLKSIAGDSFNNLGNIPF